MTKIFTCFALLFCLTTVSAQLYQVPLEEKVANSTLIVEGEVVNQNSFWNSTHSMIFTSNQIKVSKVFKGEINSEILEIVTVGGVVGQNAIFASDLLELSKGEKGIFICYPNRMNAYSQTDNSLLMGVYASTQGFIKYDEWNSKASTPFARYNSITEELYSAITTLTNQNYTIIDDKFKINSADVLQSPNAPSITSFSPDIVNGGKTYDPTTNLLTINGSGFGTASGVAAVLFDDCNDGSGGNLWPVSYSDPLIVSWTNTQIQVRVPSRAGTGNFYVRDASGSVVSSPSSIEVYYSMITRTLDGLTKQINLTNRNGNGGYTISFSNNTNNFGKDLSPGILPERATLDRAYNTWNSIVGFNTTPNVTNVQSIQQDGINLVTFDNGNALIPIDNGVLAFCLTYAQSCTPVSANQFQIIEFDINIRNTGYSTGSSLPFTAGPCAPTSSQMDLETTLLHEIGHAIGLSHINDGNEGSSSNINPAKLMNYSISPAAKRITPDASSYDGGLYCVNPKGVVFGTCSAPAATEHVPVAKIVVPRDNCVNPFPTASLAKGTVVPFDLVHATSNKNVDPASYGFNNTGNIIGITNTQYYAFKTSTAGTVTLNVTDYTTPDDISSCTNSTKGVELSLFQTADCPWGQLFPSTSGYRTFTGNGTLSAFTGLVANSTYLLVADGINNTKATFNLVFDGTALPIKFTGFTGEVLKESNLLKWTAEKVDNVARIDIERSADNNEFTSIGNITGNAVNNLKGSYNDFAPLSGKNYYRLKVTDKDGSITYSNIILLNRNDKFMVTMSPNPVRNVLNIKTSTTETGVYTFKLINTTGQTIVAKQLNVSSGNQNNTVNVSSVAKGAYHAIIYNKNGETIKSQIIVVE